MAGKGNMDSGVNNSIGAGTEQVSTEGNMDSGVDDSIGAGGEQEGSEDEDAGESGQEGTDDDGSVFEEGEKPAEDDEDSGSVFDEKEDGGSENPEEDEVNQDDFEYEFDFPDEMDVDEEMLGKTTSQFKELGIGKDKAKHLMKLGLEAQRRTEVAMQKQWDNQTIQWKKELKTDTELGGAKYKETIQKSLEVLDQYDGGEEFKKLLMDTKISNNLAVNRFLNSVHKGTAEDGIEQTRHSAPPKEVSDEEAFFPEQAKRDRMLKEG